jgi:chemotaxis signal transduction protein
MLALEFSVDNDKFLIPATAVDSVTAPPRNTAFIPRHDDIRVEMFSYRGVITPLIDFNLLLGAAQIDRSQVLTFFIDNRFFAFYISDVGSVVTVTSDMITEKHDPVSIILGRCEIDNQIYSLIDVDAFFDRVRKSARTV